MQIFSANTHAIEFRAWLIKPRLASKKAAWREFSSREESLTWLKETKPEGLFLHHPCWPVFDFDGAAGDQPLVLAAARKIMRTAGFREGKDFTIILTGGKGVRVVWRYLLPSPEDVALLRTYVTRIAEEVCVPTHRPPHLVREAREKLARLKAELHEKAELLTKAWGLRAWERAKRLKREISRLQARIENLKKKASAWRPGRGVRVEAFLDPGVGSRPQPERILGWDELHKKWGRPLPPEKAIVSPEEYRKFCRPPRNRSATVLKYAEEILPREGREIPPHVGKILEAERRRRDLLNKGKAGQTKFSWIFSLLDQEVEEKVLRLLERVVFEGTEGGSLEAADAAALDAFLLRFPSRDKGDVKEVRGPCPACGGGSRTKKGTAFVYKTGKRWYLKCHRTSCLLNSPRSLLKFCLEEGLLNPAGLTFNRGKKKIKRKAGLGTYLSPAFRNVPPSRAAEEALSLLSRHRGVLISWRLGGGKTLFAACLAAKWGKRVWALFPSWKLAEEFVQLIGQFGVSVQMLRSKKQSCPRWEKIAHLRELDLADGHICRKCPHHPGRGGECEVIKLLTSPPRREVVVGVHAHLPFALQTGDLILIDEAHHLLQKAEISLADLAKEVWAFWTELFDGPGEEAGPKLIRWLESLLPPALTKKEILGEEPPDEIKESARFLIEALVREKGEGELHKARLRLESPSSGERSDVWKALRALSALAYGKGIIKWRKEGHRTIGKLIFIDAPAVHEKFRGRLVLLSATAPPGLLKKTLGLEELPWRGYTLPRRGRLIGIVPIASTGKLNLDPSRPFPGAVKNALEIVKVVGAEGVISYKDLFCKLQEELGFREEALLGWGTHEGTNTFRDARFLVLLGRPTPPPKEVLDWLLLGEDTGETLLWLLVSPVLQAVGRLRKWWEEEATLFVIDRHFLQLQRFLLSHLGPSDLIFWASSSAADTKRKAAALREALEAPRGREEETFMRTYTSLARAEGVSRQARVAWAGRFFRVQAFAARWRAWWDLVKKQIEKPEKSDFSRLIEVFFGKIEEFLPRIFPRRGPPKQMEIFKTEVSYV